MKKVTMMLMVVVIGFMMISCGGEETVSYAVCGKIWECYHPNTKNISPDINPFESYDECIETIDKIEYVKKDIECIHDLNRCEIMTNKVDACLE